MAVKPRSNATRRLSFKGSSLLQGLWLGLGIVCVAGSILPRAGAGESKVYDQQLPNPSFTDGELEDGVDERSLPAPNGMPLLTNPPNWRKSSGQAFPLLEDTLLVSALDGNVYALETTTGKLLWTFPTGAPLVSTYLDPLDASTLRSILTPKNALIKQYKTLFEVSTRAGTPNQPAQKLDDTGEDGNEESAPEDMEVMIPGADGSLYWIDGKNIQLYHPSVKEVEHMAPSVTPDGGLLIGSRQNKVFTVDPYTGTKLHQYPNNKAVSENRTADTATVQTADTDSEGSTDVEEGADASGGDGTQHVAIAKPPVYIMRKDYTVTKHDVSKHAVRWNVSFSEVAAVGSVQVSAAMQRKWESAWERAVRMEVGEDNMLEVRLAWGVSWRRRFPTPPTAVFSPRGYRVKNLMPSLSNDLKMKSHTATLIQIGAQTVMIRRLTEGPKQVPVAAASEKFDYTHLPLLAPATTAWDEDNNNSNPSNYEALGGGSSSTGGLVPVEYVIPACKGERFACPLSTEDEEEDRVMTVVGRRTNLGGWGPVHLAVPRRKAEKSLVALYAGHNEVGAPGHEAPPQPTWLEAVGWIYTSLALGIGAVVAFIMWMVSLVRNGFGRAPSPRRVTGGKKKKKRGGRAQSSADPPSDEEGTVEQLISSGIPPEGLQVGKIFVSEKVLGSGSNGTFVFEGKYGERRAAVKRVLNNYANKVTKEVSAFEKSDWHECIVRCFDYERTDNFTWLALEYCHCNLFELILARTPALPALHKKMRPEISLDVNNLPQLWEDSTSRPTRAHFQILKDIMRGLVHLHKLGIVHRDIKPQNILLWTDADGNLRGKLSDMGIARHVEHINATFHNTAGGGDLGSAGYKAPEQLQHPPQPQTAAVDAFALGCLVFFCVTGGFHPFAKDPVHRDSNIARGDAPDLWHLDHFPEAKHLVSCLLQTDPNDRCTALEALFHPMLWPADTRLRFLVDVSDRIEGNDLGAEQLMSELEKVKAAAAGSDWKSQLSKEFLNSLSTHRSYDPKTLRDLLRIIRNKANHYHELDGDLQEYLGGSFPDGFDNFFRKRYPSLLIEVYKVVAKGWSEEDVFAKYFPNSQRPGSPRGPGFGL